MPVRPFKICDHVFYVGNHWVSAYLVDTGNGLVLIDSLYGKWLPGLIRKIEALGFDPQNIKYVVNTHGHFDHAGGSALFQKVFGSRIVMTELDWDLALTEPPLSQGAMPLPTKDIVASDGNVIVLGENKFTLLQTPGHTEGVLSVVFTVNDGDARHQAIILGGVGLNFGSVSRTETYIRSHRRLQSMQNDISVSLPNHTHIGDLFARRDKLAIRSTSTAHPFVDPLAYRAKLKEVLAAAEEKLALEKAGAAPPDINYLIEAFIPH